jgi:hypothetical protein
LGKSASGLNVAAFAHIRAQSERRWRSASAARVASARGV